ncbi:MAG: hypothetical protein PHI02_06360 [Sulfurovaceae bacterium]|nr:hypothetical protein [Sulfurovaceae bacterium]
MKLFMIASGYCEDHLKQINTHVFATYFEARTFAEEHIKEEFIIFNVYLGNYSYVDYSKAGNPLSICDKQGLDSSIINTIDQLKKLHEKLDCENPKDHIVEAVHYIEKSLKSLKSFLTSEICMVKDDNFSKE